MLRNVLFANKRVSLLRTFFKNEKNIRTSVLAKRCCTSEIPSGKTEESIVTKQLYAKIMMSGPITIADYMKEVLTHPTGGYYMKRDVFGKEGDFVTSPEISQMFGEMIGVWVAYELSKISGGPFQLVELGPGRGTLSKNILRVFKQLKLSKRVSLHLVEVSPALSLIQSQNLCLSSKEITLHSTNSEKHYREGFTEEGIKVFWYYSVKDVPKSFSVFVAHEFFDALPIHKFQKQGNVWNEILIDIDTHATKEKRFRYVLSRSPTPASKAYISPDEKREHVEISPETMVIIEYLASFLNKCGGFALIADYGHNGEKTDTFRSFRNHKQHDPLVEPGSADLTADVDFSLIDKIARSRDRVISFGPVSQRDFLKRLGIDTRLQILSNHLSEEEKSKLEWGYRMITDEDKMGECFKFFSLFPSVLRDHLTKWPVSGFQDNRQTEDTAQ